MSQLKLNLLGAHEIRLIHSTSLHILEKIGVRVASLQALAILKHIDGITIDESHHVVRFAEAAVQRALELAPRSFALYGRDKTNALQFGANRPVHQAISGEAMWVDPVAQVRREGTRQDFEQAVQVADALPNIDIVGAMIQPSEVPVEIRDVYLYAELLKRSRKPVRSWVYSRRSARYIIEILKVVAGGEVELRSHPLVDFGFEPISPLQMPPDALETMIEFARAGIPVTIGPMPQAMATAPVTLSGALALGNAETLAALVIIQTVAPRTPVIYFNSPHIMDPRTMSLVFGSPEQGLMSAAATELGKYYALPVGVNVGLTDAKIPDAQSGLEKGTTLLMGALAGADIFGGMGIAGCDQGFSLAQLVIDNEIIGFVKRTLQGLAVDTESLAYEVVERVGIGGSFLTEDHTLLNWRRESWIPQLCDRTVWDVWRQTGSKSMLERALDYQSTVLSEHTVEWMDEPMQRELDKIVAAAKGEALA